MRIAITHARFADEKARAVSREAGARGVRKGSSIGKNRVFPRETTQESQKSP